MPKTIFKKYQNEDKAMTNFNIGDRVQNTTNDKRFGKGTITAICPLVGAASVAFDGYGMDVSWSLKLMVKA